MHVRRDIEVPLKSPGLGFLLSIREKREFRLSWGRFAISTALRLSSCCLLGHFLRRSLFRLCVFEVGSARALAGTKIFGPKPL
jgi:hypothetical protein